MTGLRRPRGGMLAAPVLLASAIVLAAGSAAAADGAAGAARFRFAGHGTDHGVGFSQRGAAGRAKAGQTYDQILDHYFPGTHAETVGEDTVIRALVVKGYKRKGAVALVRGGSQDSRWTFDSPGVDGRTFPPAWRLVLTSPARSGTWRLEVRDGTGRIKARFTDDDARLTVSPVPVVDEDPTDDVAPPASAIKVLIRPSARYDTYAGSIRIGRADGRIRVVNHVPIEAFVRSVVPGEMGPANLAEALKAQAVSSRSYFLAGRNDGTAFLAFDVESDSDSQAYKGVKSEKPATTAAADATAFEIRKWKGRIARTFYHAAAGGATEASMNVFTGESGAPGTRVPYLMGGPDVDDQGRAYDADSPMYEWHTRTFTLQQLSRILARDTRTNVGELSAWPIGSEGTFLARREASITADAGDGTPAPANRGVSGRLTWIVLRGVRDGKPVRKRVAGWLFKQVFDQYRGSGDPLGSTMIFRQRVP